MIENEKNILLLLVFILTITSLGFTFSTPGDKVVEGYAFGLFLAYLMAAIDFIRLGRMDSMINEIIQHYKK